MSDETVDKSCICKSKYDLATCKEKAPHLSEQVDLIKNVLVPEKNFSFSGTTRPFKYERLIRPLFNRLCYSPSQDTSYCLSCVLFGHDYPT